MAESKFTTGMFCWNEIATRDPEAAKSFYTSLFGWETADMPMPGDDCGTYTMVSLGGKGIAGLYEMQGPMFEGVPPHWMVYMWTEDVDAAAAKVKELGGGIVVDPMDIPGIGRMAFCEDPGGAKFAVYRGNNDSVDSPAPDLHGSFCWRELLTNNTDAAGKFYTELFGWSAKASGAGSHYTEFLIGGNSHAGMMQITPDMGGVPPHWGIYVTVDDCDATVEKATSLGAKPIVPPMDIEGVGRFSTLADPTGAVISVITLSGAR